VSVVTTATPERVWQVYRALAWQEWDHDIDSMRELAPGTGLVEGAKVEITMKKDGKSHEATISKALENRSFTYTAPLPGATMTAVHTLEPVSSMLLCLADGSFERVCCYYFLLLEFLFHLTGLSALASCSNGPSFMSPTSLASDVLANRLPTAKGRRLHTPLTSKVSWEVSLSC
jgi:hypothetical protein